MFFALREIAGWVLLIGGLFLIWMGVDFLRTLDPGPHFMEGTAISFAGVMVLRCGIHLIKASTAARIVTTPRAVSAKHEKTA